MQGNFLLHLPFSCINYFRELTERLRSQGSNELFLCILNATTDGFQKHQCNGVSYRYPKAQLDLRPSFYATLGLSMIPMAKRRKRAYSPCTSMLGFISGLAVLCRYSRVCRQRSGLS